MTGRDVEGSGRDLIRGAILSQGSTNGDPLLNIGRPANEAGVYTPTWRYAKQQTVCSSP
jgi:hypothetical protein